MAKNLQDYIDILNKLDFKNMYEGDFFLTWEPGAGAAKKINEELLKEYFNQIKGLRNELTSYRAVNFGDQARMDNELITVRDISCNRLLKHGVILLNLNKLFRILFS